MITLNEAKAGLPIQLLWGRLRLRGKVPARDGELVSCPFPANHRNGDQKPSFNVYAQGQRFKCFGCSIEGGAVDLVAMALGVDEKTACWKLIELAGGATITARSAMVPPARVIAAARDERPSLTLPKLKRGDSLGLRLLEESRDISAEAVSLAVGFGVLRFADVCGFPSWLIGDGSGRAAEARRLDRLPYPPLGRLGERKAHSLKGTNKSWPVGADVLRCRPSFRAIMLVEGGPDFLAALHFLNEREVWDVWPVAMLGRSTGGTIHPDALTLLSGRKVRIYSHADQDGGGVSAAVKWGRQLANAGCTVDAFSFDGLRQRDGAPVNDLNHCCLLHFDDVAKLERLLP